MKEYRVTYEIDVDGESPEDAARRALDIMQDHSRNTFPTLDVWDEDGQGVRVTLDGTGGLVQEVVPIP